MPSPELNQHHMNPFLDAQIAAVESQLLKLRQRKAAILRKQIWELQHGAAKTQDILPRLTEIVSNAGQSGITAKEAAYLAGIPYFRALPLMKAHFRHSGAKRNSSYTVK